jgi:hypothetical protein
MAYRIYGRVRKYIQVHTFWNIMGGGDLLERGVHGDCIKIDHKPEGHVFDSRRGLFFFSIYLIFTAAIWPWGLLSLHQKWVPGIFLGVKRSRQIRLTISKPSVSRLSSKYETLDISQPYGPPRSVIWIVLLVCRNIGQKAVECTNVTQDASSLGHCQHDNRPSDYSNGDIFLINWATVSFS